MKNVAFLILAVWGCSPTSRQEGQVLGDRLGSTTSKVEFYFCGCGPCDELVRTFGPQNLAGAEVAYDGSPGDAAAFAARYGDVFAVVPDVRGAKREEAGISVCPGVRMPDNRIIGNGEVITEEQVLLIRATLGGA